MHPRVVEVVSVEKCARRAKEVVDGGGKLREKEVEEEEKSFASEFNF